jgi:hypothetical protein
MEYTRKYNELKTIFNSDQKKIVLPDSDIKIYNIEFLSDSSLRGFSNKKDTFINENLSFTYPVFTPENKDSDKVILLLHGLNERSWVKYLAWAFRLAQSTGSYVILFPISFHINRSPEQWKDPRAMINFLQDRNSHLGNIDKSSFANIALSSRLTEDPMRFFNSGYQTMRDIVKLLTSIRNGEHPVIPPTCNFNFFAYSIGAFLAEIILMGNPENLLTKSKLFIFSGGSVFSNMHGTSKLIMDKLAFEKIYSFYLNDFEKSLHGISPLVNFLRLTQVGLAFRSMIDIDRLKAFRESILRKLKGQIHSVTLLKDTVIPSTGVVNTLSSWTRELRDSVEVWDFPYSYCHENPFPVFNSSLSQEVDNCFDRLFLQATAFLK